MAFFPKPLPFRVLRIAYPPRNGDLLCVRRPSELNGLRKAAKSAADSLQSLLTRLPGLLHSRLFVSNQRSATGEPFHEAELR